MKSLTLEPRLQSLLLYYKHAAAPRNLLSRTQSTIIESKQIKQIFLRNYGTSRVFKSTTLLAKQNTMKVLLPALIVAAAVLGSPVNPKAINETTIGMAVDPKSINEVRKLVVETSKGWNPCSRLSKIYALRSLILAFVFHPFQSFVALLTLYLQL